MPNAKLKLTFGESNGTPGFKVNDTVIEPNTFTKGTHIINFDYDYNRPIEFTMFGKSYRDVVIENNKVVKDKYVAIEELVLEFCKLESWQFHKNIWDPYFGMNEDTKILFIPDREHFPIWVMEVTL
jgi:hypothetical protein